MRSPNFSDPQFVDALGVGGLNAAFGTVSGSIASVGSGVWAVPGLLAPESASIGFTNLVANVVLPPSFGLVSSGGIVVRAHGTLSNQDTQSYAVNFASLVPNTGSVTAYLTAQVQQIQQNPVPLPGPPPGFPSFNPTFIPTVSYATNLFTLALAGTTTPPDNSSTFELVRFTLTAGQSFAPAASMAGQVRATPLIAKTLLQPTSGGVLSIPQLQQTISPTNAGITLTLPTAQQANGVVANFLNVNNSAYTIAAPVGSSISGLTGGNVTSIGVPSSGAVALYANGSVGIWQTVALNTGMNNTWTGTNTFNKGATALLDLSSTFQYRAIQGNYGSGWRNDGASTFLLSTNNGDSGGTFSALRPFAWNMTNGVVTIDQTGAGTSFGGSTTTTGNSFFGTSGAFFVNPNNSGSQLLNFATNQFLQFTPGNGIALTTANALTFTAPAGVQINGSLATTGPINALGNVVANNGRLRATLGARGSADPSAAALLSDFVNTGSELILPNGWIAQWGVAGVACTNTQTEGGFTWFFGTIQVNFATFPTTVAIALATPIDTAGHLVINANVQILTNGAIAVTPHASAVIGVNFYWLVIGF